MRDIGGRPELAERNLPQQRSGLGLIERPGHVGFDEPGGDAVDRNAAAAEFARQGAGHPGDAGLGGGIVRLAGIAAGAHD